MKDSEEEEDEDTGDLVTQNRLVDCCAGDGLGDGGCGCGGGDYHDVLMRLKLVELKARCRERKLKIPGNKSVLVDWLLEDGVIPGNDIRCGEGGDSEGGVEIDMESGVGEGNGKSDGSGFVGEGREDVMQLVLMLEDEEDEGVVDLFVVDKSGGSILKPCGRCRQGVIGTHHNP